MAKCDDDKNGVSKSEADSEPTEKVKGKKSKTSKPKNKKVKTSYACPAEGCEKKVSERKYLVNHVLRVHAGKEPLNIRRGNSRDETAFFNGLDLNCEAKITKLESGLGGGEYSAIIKIMEKGLAFDDRDRKSIEDDDDKKIAGNFPCPAEKCKCVFNDKGQLQNHAFEGHNTKGELNIQRWNSKMGKVFLEGIDLHCEIKITYLRESLGQDRYSAEIELKDLSQMHDKRCRKRRLVSYNDDRGDFKPEVGLMYDTDASDEDYNPKKGSGSRKRSTSKGAPSKKKKNEDDIEEDDVPAPKEKTRPAGRKSKK